MLLDRDALEAVGGWPVVALTEDLERSTRLLAAGIRIGWVADPSIWEDAAPDPRSFVGQRLRWAEGSLRRTLATGPRRRSPVPVAPPARLDGLAPWLQALVPPAILGLLAGSLAARRLSRSAALLVALGAATALVVDPTSGRPSDSTAETSDSTAERRVGIAPRHSLVRRRLLPVVSGASPERSG